MKYSDVKVIYLLENRYGAENSMKPVLYYPGALKETSLEKERDLLTKWSSGISGYHRNHRSSHEVLGIIQGSAALELGSDQKVQLEVKPGDLIVFPSGTEKRPVSASPDFLACGLSAGGEQEELDPLLSEVLLLSKNGTQVYQLAFNL